MKACKPTQSTKQEWFMIWDLVGVCVLKLKQPQKIRCNAFGQGGLLAESDARSGRWFV